MLQVLMLQVACLLVEAGVMGGAYLWRLSACLCVPTSPAFSVNWMSRCTAPPQPQVQATG